MKKAGGRVIKRWGRKDSRAEKETAAAVYSLTH